MLETTDGIDTMTCAVALSMYDAGHHTADILTATDLTSEQLNALVAQREQHPADTAADTPDTNPPDPAAIEELLSWGEQHQAKGVQTLAARARSALAELAQRRDGEQAVAAAEAQVERLRRQLAAAEQKLKQAKTGKHSPAPTPAAVTELAADRAERDRIRTWARENGYQVADRGSIAQQILDAYAAPDTATLRPTG